MIRCDVFNFYYFIIFDLSIGLLIFSSASAECSCATFVVYLFEALQIFIL